MFNKMNNNRNNNKLHNLCFQHYENDLKLVSNTYSEISQKIILLARIFTNLLIEFNPPCLKIYLKTKILRQLKTKQHALMDYEMKKRLLRKAIKEINDYNLVDQKKIKKQCKKNSKNEYDDLRSVILTNSYLNKKKFKQEKVYSFMIFTGMTN